MAAINAVGNDGSVALPSNYDMNVKVWAATVAFVSTDTTGFTATGKTRRLGIVDITGSLAGQPTVGVASNTTPFGQLTSGAIGSQPGGTLTLATYGAATAATNATNVAYLQFGAVFNSFAFNADKNGDQTLTMNFEMNDSNGPTVVWATSLP